MSHSAAGAALDTYFLYSAFVDKRLSQPAADIARAAIVIPHACRRHQPHALKSVGDAGSSAEARSSNSFVAP